MQSSYIPFVLAHKLYPLCNVKVSIFYGDSYEMHQVVYSHEGEWCDIPIISIHDGTSLPIPNWIEAEWLSVVECENYALECEIDEAKAQLIWNEAKENGWSIKYLQIGLVPYGGVAIWLCGSKKTVLLHWLKAEKREIGIVDDKPFPTSAFGPVCDEILKQKPEALHYLNSYGLPQQDMFDNWMRQYSFRYDIVFCQLNGNEWIPKVFDEDSDEMEPEIEFVADYCYDGTYDKTHSDHLFLYHESGMPKRLALCWQEGNNTMKAFFWFEYGFMNKVFKDFFGSHPGINADFQMLIDSGVKRYDVRLSSCESTCEPIIIPYEAYQVVVFCDGFEFFRSENYAQEDGAWNW